MNAHTRTDSAPSTKRTTSGQSLVPDLSKLTKGVIGKHWYWMGALPGCPREHLDIGSTDFPKMTEDVRRDSRGKTHRTPKIGSLRMLTMAQLHRIEDDLRFCIIRFDKADSESPGGPGDGLEVLDNDRRKGRPIRIPSDPAVEKAIKDGRPLRPYSAEATDEPAARYVFMKLCDQDKPQRSDSYPEPMEVDGLPWPSGTQE